MAKKTKKQKQAADHRRKIQTYNAIPKYTVQLSDISQLEVTPEAKSIKPQTFRPQQALVYGDIQKTIIIATLILGIELLLFWMLEHGGDVVIARFL